MMKSQGKYKRIMVVNELHLSANILGDILLSLAEDVTLVDIHNNFTAGCKEIILEKPDWEEIQIYRQEIPTLATLMSPLDVELFIKLNKPPIKEESTSKQSDVIHLPPGFNLNMITSGRVKTSCICDMAYTGLRYHRRDCPSVE